MAQAPNIQIEGNNNDLRQRRKFVLCFDGTGNKFQGNNGDSNILKIYSMLDRTDAAQFHYYQPGIGTYTNSKSLSSDSRISRIESWYNKAKDSAIGSTLDEHVMAGYKFLMRYYQTGDDILFFGFSRGAYIARFLAEMLDHVGLLSAGNEELVRFVWKTFAKWQIRPSGTSKADVKARDDLRKFMFSFRETFSRPVRRIRFLGLFDTVNSVSKFETAWMERSKRFPYTARSSALVIRHAVAIDERRAKFRQDLISQKKDQWNQDPSHPESDQLEPKPHKHGSHSIGNESPSKTERDDMRFTKTRRDALTVPGMNLPSLRFRSHSRGRSMRSQSAVQSSNHDGAEYCDSDDEDEKADQDVEEIWFPGGHADIGGGWPPDEPEKYALSHGPLVWMVREAQKAGLVFLPEKLKELNCYLDEYDVTPPSAPTFLPEFELNNEALPPQPPDPADKATTTPSPELTDHSEFLSTLHSACTNSRIHDCLSFNNGLSHSGVLTWRVMEYIPFRRMDLRPDGSWKAIRWPLPMGEVRDVPKDAKIHNSVVKRMRAREDYRPGNLIVGGGGRGRRTAPKEFGMGEWVVLRGEGDVVGEVWVRKGRDDGGGERGVEGKVGNGGTGKE